MKHQKNMIFAVRSGLALALTLAIWSPIHAQSSQPAEGQTTAAAGMKERCQAMKSQKQKMAADIKAQDDQLAEQVAQMNAAPADQKTVLMAAVLTQMAEQRIAMDARHTQMEEGMMQHTMQHMQMGKESMSQCPMMTGSMPGMKGMKGMKGTVNKSAGTQKEQ